MPIIPIDMDVILSSWMESEVRIWWLVLKKWYDFFCFKVNWCTNKSKQECIPVGCIPSTAVAVLGRGYLPGGCVCLEVCLPGSVCLGVYTSPLWTEFLTHTCENITFQQLLLRTVNIPQLILAKLDQSGSNRVLSFYPICKYTNLCVTFVTCASGVLAVYTFFRIIFTMNWHCKLSLLVIGSVSKQLTCIGDDILCWLALLTTELKISRLHVSWSGRKGLRLSWVSTVLIHRYVCLFVRTARQKVKLTFILCFGSNNNAFYLYRATSVACSSTSCSGHAQQWKGCGYCADLSVPCILPRDLYLCLTCF